MKKILLAGLLLFVVCLAGCNSFEEKKAEKAIHTYYDALLENDYETAFKGLFFYEQGITTPTSLTQSETETVFTEKIAYLESRGYKVKDYHVRGVEYEDGHTFWHHIDVVIELDGKRKKWKETAFYQNGKLSVSGEDPLIEYRDGKMDVTFES